MLCIVFVRVIYTILLRGRSNNFPRSHHFFSLIGSLSVKLVGQPDDFFEGDATVTFEANSIAALDNSTEGLLSNSIQAESGAYIDTSGSLTDRYGRERGGKLDVKITFFHCEAGTFWSTGSCEPCADITSGGTDDVSSRVCIVREGTKQGVHFFDWPNVA